jgi:hypothetical protein
VPATVVALLIVTVLPRERGTELPSPALPSALNAPGIAEATTPRVLPSQSAVRATDPRAAASVRQVAPASRVAMAAPVRRATLEVITNQPAVLAELWRHHESARAEAEAVELPPDRVVVDGDGFIQVPELIVAPIAVGGVVPAPGAQGGVKRIVSPQAAGSPK